MRTALAVLAAATTITVGASQAPEAHAARPGGILADVDGDGRDDEVVESGRVRGGRWPRDLEDGSRRAVVVAGRGPGPPARIEAPGRLRLEAKGRILDAAIVGDMDLDGRAEVAVVRRRAPRALRELLVVSGRPGAGTVRADARGAALLRLVLPDTDEVPIAAGDLDGDGRADLAFHATSRRLLVVRGTSRSSAAVPIARAADVLLDVRRGVSGGGILNVSPAGDTDGDGNGDLAVAFDPAAYCGEGGCAGRTVVVRGAPAGRTVTLAGSERRGYRLEASDGSTAGFAVHGRTGYVAEPAGDVDGDGLADVVTSTDEEAHSAIVFGKRDGAPVVLGDFHDRDSWRSVHGASPLFGGQQPTFGAGDTDGDGLGDVAILTGRRLRVVPGRPDRAAQTVRDSGWLIVPGRGKVEWAWPAGDADGDGLSDIVVLTGSRGRPSRMFVVLGARDRAAVSLAAPGGRAYEIR